jgi:hypothetical protein
VGSSPIDKQTQGKASSGALGVAGNLGTSGQSLYNSGTGTQSRVQNATNGFLNPSSMNVSSPSGAFAVQYQDEKNQNAQAADQALQSTNRNLASRGLGVAPAGFSAANDLTAYQNQANANQQAFQNAVTNQQNQAVQNFWNAANLQNGQANTDIQSGLQAQQGAGSIYDSLYGTASQQKQNPILGTLGALGSLGGGVGAAAKGFS